MGMPAATLRAGSPVALAVRQLLSGDRIVHLDSEPDERVQSAASVVAALDRYRTFECVFAAHNARQQSILSQDVRSVGLHGFTQAHNANRRLPRNRTPPTIGLLVAGFADRCWPGLRLAATHSESVWWQRNLSPEVHTFGFAIQILIVGPSRPWHAHLGRLLIPDSLIDWPSTARIPLEVLLAAEPVG